MANELERLPTREELRELPRWARVAFAVRCAQRVFPLLERWDQATRHSAAVARVIRLAADAAAGGRNGIADEAATSAYEAYDKAILEGVANIERAFHAAAASNAAAYAAKAAANAANTTTINAPNAYAMAAISAAEAANAAAAMGRTKGERRSPLLLLRATTRDFGCLLSIAKNAPHFDDDTPIDPKSIGTLWIDGAPEWYYDSELLKGTLPESAAASEVPGLEPLPSLDLYFEPGSASKESVQRVMEALSKLHIAAGGAGLEIHPDDGFVHVRELVEA